VSRSASVDETREENTAAIGLLIFLGSSILLFITLLAAALLLRLSASGAAPIPPWWWSLTATALLFAVVYQIDRARSRAAARVGATLFLGALVVLWCQPQLRERSAEPNSNALFFTLTGLHALYVVVGLCALPSREREQEQPLWSIYWRFVGGAWIITLASAYLP
jgi:heme/copper-type cytochrome/quinol oxidase subunit 3